MAEAFVAQNPDCVQPNHPAQIRLKSGSSRPTNSSVRKAPMSERNSASHSAPAQAAQRAALRTRLVQRRAVKQVMWHQHESGPHDMGRADPKVVVVERAVFIARLMVE